MADPRFHSVEGPFSLAALVEATGTTLGAGANAALEVTDVSPLQTAGAAHLSFLDNRKYIDQFESSAAGACLVHPKFAERAPAGMALLLSEQPYMAYALAAQLFYPRHIPEPGISLAANVDPGAEIAPDARIEAGVFVGAHAKIGAATHIHANVAIGAGVEVGADTIVGMCASLSHCVIGNAVTIHSGARIGQDGFGFAPSAQGHVKVPQLGRVIVHDNVEIGANTTIDRGSGPDTVIGAGCWIDNLVQIAHNVVLGRGCIVVAQVGISGSTRVGDFVQIGGQAGLTGHLEIGAGARIAAQAGVMRDIEPGATFGGSPAVPVRTWHRQTAALNRLTNKNQ